MDVSKYGVQTPQAVARPEGNPTGSPESVALLRLSPGNA
jgi:hypothetical protein